MRNYLLICLSLVMMVFVVSSCYEIVYQVETKGSCIKFEDAQYDQDPDPEVEDWVDASLGDDEVVQTDMLAVQVDVPVDDVLVSLKYGKEKVNNVLVPTDGTEVAVGAFRVSIAETPEDPDDPEVVTYLIGVTSDNIPGGGRDGTAALSNITICFGDAEILAPEDGEPFPTFRGTDLEEPGVPEEDQ